MAEEPTAEAAGHLPAFDFQAGVGIFNMRLRIDNPWLAAGLIGGGTLTLGAFYILNREAVDTAVKLALVGLADRVFNIRPSSVLVEFVCYTKERFLEFMDAFATGTVKQRLQKQLSIIGFKDELEVTIAVYDPEPEMRKEMKETVLGITGASDVELMGSVKVGTPTDDELEKLAFAIAGSLRELGRRLGLKESELRVIDEANAQLSEKGYHMLKQWKQERGAAASYKVLDDALRHVQRQDLAEKFCQGEDIMEFQPFGFSKLSEELMTVAAGAPSVKGDIPTDKELEELAHYIESEWKELGRFLGFPESVLDEIDTEWEPLWLKGNFMLKQWKKNQAAASCKVLNDALQHVQRQDLAKTFCQGGDIRELEPFGFTKSRKEKEERTSDVEPPSDSASSGVKSLQSVKVGTPTDDELKELGFAIADIWKELGRRLGVSGEMLDKIDYLLERVPLKGYRMLTEWKKERGGDASYKVLNDALQHELIQRQDLAKNFCQD